ncbi:MAG TPA: hypothetical protein VMX55_13750 [candidate division Zixibacteria bacterium]|nr:hypothetical protein [candidate division Zixibacteria bacterium]
MVDEERTQLETELHTKINEIKKYNILPKYIPRRVEPGIAFDLKDENKWSRYMGETLFINQELLADSLLRSIIFWRESFLLFAPLEMRNIKWIKDLANLFPLSVKISIEQEQKWEELWKEVQRSDELDLQFMKLLAKSAGPKGILDVLKLGIQRTFQIKKENCKGEIGSSKSYTLSQKELTLIYYKIFHDTIGVSKNAIDLIKIALTKQTLKLNELALYTSKSKTSISKTIKRLTDMNILYLRKSLNLKALNLTRYFVLLNCTRTQNNLLNKKIMSSPYLISQRINCLNNCLITHVFFGPDTQEFYNLLENYYGNLKNNGDIAEYFIVNAINKTTNYLLKYFNPNTKKQEINFIDMAIECNLLSALSKDSLSKRLENLENIVVEHINANNIFHELDIIDIEIINQMISGNQTRRGIQKKIKRDMNETVNRIKILEDKKIIFDEVNVFLPDSDGQITFYIEDDTLLRKKDLKQNNNTPSLVDRLKYLCYHLPNVFFSDLIGSFHGLMIHAYLPYSNTIEFADFINWYLPAGLKVQCIIGSPLLEYTEMKLPVNRWIDEKWQFSANDFNW